MTHADSLGDLLKDQERVEAGRKADPFLPLVARIDGKCFSKFTKGLQRPFDVRLTDLMKETTRFLMEESDSKLGYCQSDEITLYWFLDKENHSNREFWFGGKFQKMTSVLAGTASSFFCGNLPGFLPEKVGKYPVFDARVWNVPDMEHVYKNFLWRYRDAQKNSVSMYARAFFSHKNLQGKTCNEMKEMLAQNGTPWEDLPGFFKNGIFLQRKLVSISPEDVSLENIPEQYRPKENVLRSVIEEISVSHPRDLFPSLNQSEQ